MTIFVKALLACAIGVAVGLAASAYALTGASPFDRVRLGPWEIEPHAGSMDSDPYTRARVERSGEIPLAVGEGLRLIARDDDDGRPLDARCVYRVGPRVPPARYWTISVVDPEGWPIENAAQRYGFRSSEILRAANGDFTITISAEAAPGNWLPVVATKPFALALRLYDTPLGATAGGIEKSTTPQVVRIGCAR